MLNPNFTQLGVGHYFLENDTGNENWNHYWTQKFHAWTPNIDIPGPDPTEPPDEIPTTGHGDGSNPSFEQEVLELVNQERANFGLQPLVEEPLLTQAARTHSTNMALQDFYSHTGADGSEFTDRILATGFSITGASAENIYASPRTPQAAVDGWMKSPGHRENILNPDFTQIGVGHYFLENDTGNVNWNHYWTQKFHAGSTHEGIGNFDIYASSSLDGFESEELKLYNLINEYRMENNLDPIPASRALTTVANRRVLDLAKNVGEVTHSGSDFIYDANDSSTWSNMWDAPARFNTGYRDIGYENVIGYSGFDGPTITAEEALTGWKNSPPHNAVILNQEEWANMEWNALGVGLYNGYGSLWFGEQVDPTGVPSGYQ
ncbi:MAG: hypothetical protein EA414_19910 [Arthrospira sp. PLM2.Bin9]|nr:MAG: hypothetical protein EA414_19910 [Arthrospira sp. PLM2.Bin9]